MQTPNPYLLPNSAHQENVCDDGPVEVESDLAEEQQSEGQVDVPGGREHPGGQKHGREDESYSADDGIGAGILLLQLGAQNGPERNSNDAREHCDETKDESNAEMWKKANA